MRSRRPLSRRVVKRSRTSRTPCITARTASSQKVPLAGATEASAPRGPIRGRIAANKRRADGLHAERRRAHPFLYTAHAGSIQQAVNAGKLAVNMTQPGRQVKLEFKDYLKTGDLLGIDVELPTNRLLGMNVSSYLDTPKDAVQMNVTMSVLSDGTIYTEKSVLDAPAKGIAVTVKNRAIGAKVDDAAMTVAAFTGDDAAADAEPRSLASRACRDTRQLPPYPTHSAPSLRRPGAPCLRCVPPCAP